MPLIYITSFNLHVNSVSYRRIWVDVFIGLILWMRTLRLKETVSCDRARVWTRRSGFQDCKLSHATTWC